MRLFFLVSARLLQGREQNCLSCRDRIKEQHILVAYGGGCTMHLQNFSLFSLTLTTGMASTLGTAEGLVISWFPVFHGGIQTSPSNPTCYNNVERQSQAHGQEFPHAISLLRFCQPPQHPLSPPPRLLISAPILCHPTTGQRPGFRGILHSAAPAPSIQ